ncbi:unnamed protein product [Prunus armeniaca]
MVDTRCTKSNATTTGPSHGFVVETSMQPHRIMAANALQPSSSALQPPSTAGIAEQPPHDPGTSTALQSPAPITGAALPRCHAFGAQQQPHHSCSRHRRRRPERPSLRAEDDYQRPPARSRTNTQRQAAEESSQAQSLNLPHGQGT